MPKSSEIASLLDKYLDDPDLIMTDTTLGSTVSALRGRRLSPHLPKLIRIATSRHPPVGSRRIALMTVGRSGTAGVTDVLRAALKDPDERIQLMAAYALGTTRAPMRRQLLESVLLDRSFPASVRTTAAATLQTVNCKSSAPALISALKDPEVDVRFFACRSLGYIASARALPYLEAIARYDEGICEIKPDGRPMRDEARNAIDEIACGGGDHTVYSDDAFFGESAPEFYTFTGVIAQP